MRRGEDRLQPTAYSLQLAVKRDPFEAQGKSSVRRLGSDDGRGEWIGHGVAESTERKESRTRLGQPKRPWRNGGAAGKAPVPSYVRAS